MKTTSKTLMNNWEELHDIFDIQPFKFDLKVKERIERLGYKVVWNKCKHPKMYIELDKTYVITLSTTPSDRYAGRQILRQIRKVYENYDKRRID